MKRRNNSKKMSRRSFLLIAQIALVSIGFLFLWQSGQHAAGEKAAPMDFDGDGTADHTLLRFPNVAPPGVAPISWYVFASGGEVPTSPGSNVTVSSYGVTVTFPAVGTAGTTTFTQIPPASAGSPPVGITLCPTCEAFDISTSAAYTPPVTVCLPVPASLSDSEFQMLRLLHGEGGVLVDRTTGRFTDPTRRVCGSVPSLSPFVLGLQAAGPSPSPTPSPSPQTVQFSSSAYFASEDNIMAPGEARPDGNGLANITVTRSGGTTGSVVVSFITANGTATGGASCTAGVDYISTFGVVTFNSGESSKQVQVNLCDDAAVEGPETVNLSLNSPVGATLGTPNTATLTINDNDVAASPTPTVVPSPSPTVVPSPTATVAASPTPTVAPSPTPTVAPSPTPTVAPSPTPSPGARNLRVVNTSVPLGATSVVVPVVLDALGNESSLSFSLNFNTAVFSNPVVTIGSGVPAGSNLGTNLAQAGQGRIGVLVDSVNTYQPGTRQVITVTFAVSPNAGIGSYPVTFGSVPTPQSISDPQGSLLPANYVAGNVQVGSTAAGVEISGRVLTPDGRGLRNATVFITDQQGVRRSYLTGSFGYFRFDDVEVGSTLIVSVGSRRYRFESRLLQVFDTISELNFVGQE